MRFLLLPALLLATTTPVQAQAPSRASDSVAVMATIDTMLAALRKGDAAGLRATFDSAIRITLLRPAPGGDVQVHAFTGEQFASLAATQTPDEPIRNAKVQLDGDLATVWAEYQVRKDGKVSHCGYDAFTLVRKQKAWKILSVADTFRQQGCGPVW